MPTTNTTRAQRREMILRALRGESQTKLGEEYGLTRYTVNRHVKNTVREADRRYEEARQELEFWREVLELTEG